MEKQISVVVAGSDEIRDIGIPPGITVREVLDDLSLKDYKLSRKGGELLTLETDLYETANDSEKLFATPPVSVGVGGSALRALLSRFFKWAKGFLGFDDGPMPFTEHIEREVKKKCQDHTCQAI